MNAYFSNYFPTNDWPIGYWPIVIVTGERIVFITFAFAKRTMTFAFAKRTIDFEFIGNEPG